MQGGIFTYVLLIALAIALLVAAVTDFRRRQIDNWLTAAIALVAPLFWLAAGLPLADAGWLIGQALITFTICALLFAAGQMGGGDVKLLAALALWFPPMAFGKLIMVMALLGGAISVAAAIRNYRQIESRRALDSLALAGGIVWLVFSIYALIVIAGAQPLPIGRAFAGIAANGALGIWLAWMAVLLLVAAVCFGVIRLARRQTVRVKLPYGIAISCAGIWVLASTSLPTLLGTANAG